MTRYPMLGSVSNKLFSFQENISSVTGLMFHMNIKTTCYIFSNRLSKEGTSKLKSGSDNPYGKWNAEILR